jgi:hypothetical protein
VIETSPPKVQPGQRLARSICLHLLGYDFVSIEEFTPERGKRVDVMALGPKGEIWVFECKSSRDDFCADRKWRGYLAWCDRYFWVVDADFPTDLLPQGTGLVIADDFGAEIIRMGVENKLSPPRRKALTRKFARTTARRLHRFRDQGL